MQKIFALAVALTIVPLYPSQAQDATPKPPEATERHASGESGKPIRLGVFASLKPDCTSGPLPAIRLTKAPINGTVVVKRGNVRMTNVASCLAAEVPAYVAFYTSKPDYAGEDVVQLEVKTATGGATQLQNIRVTVRTKGTAI